MDQPADVSLGGLRPALRWLTESLGMFPAYLVDLTLTGDPRYAMTPVQLCGWLDQLQRKADEAANHARLVSHACDILWERSAAESAERRRQQLAQREPQKCLVCNGRGFLGRDSFGNWDGCDRCEGTGIDPDDPAFPH